MSLAIQDKLSFVLLAWTCAFLLPWQFNIVFIALVVLLATSAKQFKPVTLAARTYFSRFAIYSVIFVFVLVVANGLLLHEGPVRFTLLFLDFYETGIVYGLTVSMRLILLSLSILVFFASTHFQDFAQYMQSLGMPRSLLSILLLTMFFLEQLPHRISQVFTAQEARGAPVRAGIIARSRGFFLILSPLVLSSIVESVERGVALELRGYHLRRSNDDIHSGDLSLHFGGYSFLVLSLIIIIHFIVRWLTH
jgi:energy-coupling factor transporter transmembrane protein EcfT